MQVDLLGDGDRHIWFGWSSDGKGVGLVRVVHTAIGGLTMTGICYGFSFSVHIHEFPRTRNVKFPDG